jgi:hypothetical protein
MKVFNAFGIILLCSSLACCTGSVAINPDAGPDAEDDGGFDIDNATLAIVVSASSNTIQVGDLVEFEIQVSGGQAPYTYLWNFDDLNSYKQAAPQTASTSHTFNWPGRHHVTATVLDQESTSQKAVVIIDVVIDKSEVVVNAVSDCGCDPSGTISCTDALDACMADSLGNQDNLRIEFPSGTYLFTSKICHSHTLSDGSEKVEICGIALSMAGYQGLGLHGVSLVGVGDPRPTLRYDNTHNCHGDGCYDDNTLHRHAFLDTTHLPTDPEHDQHVFLSKIKFEMTQDPDNYVLLPRFLYGFDSPVSRIYFSAEQCDFKNYGLLGYTMWAIHKHNNMLAGGSYNNDQGATELIRYINNGISLRNYIAQMDEAHSHIWYFTGSDHTYVIDNYADFSNHGPGKIIGQLKMEIHDTQISGNILRNNSRGSGWYLGAVDAQAHDTSFFNNRVLATENGMLLLGSSANINIYDNFFCDIIYHMIVAGHDRPPPPDNNGVPVLGVTVSDNILGINTPSKPSLEPIVCKFEEYGLDLECDITEINTIDNDLRCKPGDPVGWCDETNGYHDPGVFEFVPPVVNIFNIDDPTDKNVVILNMDVSDSGSGMTNVARFPFHEGGLMQFSNDNVHWSAVIPYASAYTWKLSDEPGIKTVYARFRDRDGNWSSTVSQSVER